MFGLTPSVAWARRKFAKELPLYYDALATRLESVKGKPMYEIFADDAQRYAVDEDGNHKPSARSVLSAYWAERLPEVGGDLAKAFEGTVPREDLTLIRLGQSMGNDALPSTFKDMARISGLIQRAKSLFMGTTAVAILAAAIVLGTLVATPTVTAPLLKSLYLGMPTEYYPASANRLFALADTLNAILLVLLLAIAGVAYFVAWSLPNLTGPLRKKLDRRFIWRLYRDFKGALFLATLATMTKPRGTGSNTLEQALSQMQEGSTPYVAWHIDMMLANISSVPRNATLRAREEGSVNALNTGLIDIDSFFYLMDVNQGSGLETGLLKAGARVEGPTLAMVEARAKLFSRTLLTVAFATMIGWAYLHISTSKDFGAAMRNYYQSK
jgi:hypothetical protein